MFNENHSLTRQTCAPARQVILYITRSPLMYVIRYITYKYIILIYKLHVWYLHLCIHNIADIFSSFVLSCTLLYLICCINTYYYVSLCAENRDRTLYKTIYTCYSQLFNVVYDHCSAVINDRVHYPNSCST